MNANQKECLSRIEKAFKFYLSHTSSMEQFKGQINIEVNCLDNNIVSTSIYVNRGSKNKNVDNYQKMFYTINNR